MRFRAETALRKNVKIPGNLSFYLSRKRLDTLRAFLSLRGQEKGSPEPVLREKRALESPLGRPEKPLRASNLSVCGTPAGL